MWTERGVYSSVAPPVYNYWNKQEHIEHGFEGNESIESREWAAFSGRGRRPTTPTRCSAGAQRRPGGSDYFLDMTALGGRRIGWSWRGRSADAQVNIPDFAS